MQKCPIDIAENDLSIDQDLVYLKFNGKEYKAIGYSIPFYTSEVAEVKNKTDKLKVLYFLFTNEYSGIDGINFQDSSFFPMLSADLHNVVAYHDPVPNTWQYFHPFSSLQSIQWHMLRHGIADYWLEPYKPYILCGRINESDMETIWHNFRVRVKCERWSLDLPNMTVMKRQAEWKKSLSSLHKLQHGRRCHGCYACINEQGSSKFIECCRYFESYRVDYLKTIRQWTLDTIQDEKNLEFYGNNRDVQNEAIMPARRHIHMIKSWNSDLYAYVMDNAGYQKTDVYLIKFQLIEKSGGWSEYHCKTVHGLKTRHSEEKAKQYVLDHARYLREDQETKFTNYCHPINWDAII